MERFWLEAHTVQNRSLYEDDDKDSDSATALLLASFGVEVG